MFNILQIIPRCQKVIRSRDTSVILFFFAVLPDNIDFIDIYINTYTYQFDNPAV